LERCDAPATGTLIEKTTIMVGGGRVSQVTGLAEMLGLPGVEIDLVEREENGGAPVYVTSASGAVRGVWGAGRRRCGRRNTSRSA
jgi:hypothetical protein